jgi:hypothetical protein
VANSDQYEQLRDLAERLLWEPDWKGMQEGEPTLWTRPSLLVGEIPDDLKVKLPLPEQTRVVGTLIRSEGDVTVVLDSVLEPEEIDRFYRERLGAEGWESLPEPPPHVGFDLPGNLWGARLASPAQGVRLIVMHGPTDPGSGTSLTIRLLSQPRRSAEFMESLHFPIPELKSPPGSFHVSWGAEGSGSDGRARSYRNVASVNYVTNPAEHYHRQLERAGWRLVRSARLPDGVSSHSIWTFEDERGDSWRGILMVVEKSRVPRRYTAYLEAEWQARNLFRRRTPSA